MMAMLDTVQFFELRIEECRKFAAHSINKNDREFWLKMAGRWGGLLKTRQNGDGGIVRPSRFGRSILVRRIAKRRRAA
jgi:hypothetical protein